MSSSHVCLFSDLVDTAIMAASLDILADLQGKVVCALCLDEYVSPRTLPCLHTFCLSCLDDYLEAPFFQHSRRLECPLCRSSVIVPSNGASGFPVNITVVGITEMLAKYNKKVRKCAQGQICELCLQDVALAEFKCDDCRKNMCERCKGIHSKISMGHNVNLIKPQAATGGPVVKESDYCGKHAREKVKFYCKSCDMIICRLCRQITHVKPDHKCQDLPVANQEWLSELMKLKATAQAYRKGYVTEINELRTKAFTCGVEEDMLSGKVKESKEVIASFVEEHFGRIESHIKKLCTSNQEMIEERQQKLKGHLSQLDHWFDIYPSSSAHSNRNTDLKDDVTFLKNLVQRNELIQKEKRLDLTKVSLREAKFDVTQLTKQLERVSVVGEVTRPVLRNPIGIATISTDVDVKIVIGGGENTAAIYSANHPTQVIQLKPPPSVCEWNPQNVVSAYFESLIVNFACPSAGGGLYRYGAGGQYMGAALQNFGFIDDVSFNKNSNLFTLLRYNQNTPTMLYRYKQGDASCKLGIDHRDQVAGIEVAYFVADHVCEGFSVISHSNGVTAVRGCQKYWFYACRSESPGKLVAPRGVAVRQCAGGEIYVADRDTGRIIVLSCRGEFISDFMVSSGVGIMGLDMDDKGKMYVVNNNTSQLHIFHASN